MLSDDYLYRFGGIERLYSREALQTLSQSNVLIVGIGGVGSWTAEALTRSGVGHLCLMDFDDICISNTNRQVHTTASSIGNLKTQTMKARLEQINPDIKVELIEERFDSDQVEIVFSKKLDLVIDATDGYRQKCLLIKICWEKQIPMVTVGGSGGKKDPTQIQTADLNKSYGDTLLHQTRKTLRREFGLPRGRGPWGIQCVFSPEGQSLPPGECPAGPLDCQTGFGTASFFTGSMGLTAAWKGVKLLLGEHSKE